MKIIDIHKFITADYLHSLLQQRLNPQFQHQRQSNISFTFKNTGNGVEILQPELYENFLFRIEIKGTELLIIRGSDYIDDVNELTVESILFLLFGELAGEEGITFVLDG
jgi:excinuclease UvrABC helicase subunit UvrB